MDLLQSQSQSQALPQSLEINNEITDSATSHLTSLVQDKQQPELPKVGQDPFDNPIPTPPNTNGKDDFAESPMDEDIAADGDGDDMETSFSMDPSQLEEPRQDHVGGSNENTPTAADHSSPVQTPTTINPSQTLISSSSFATDRVPATINGNGTLKRSLESDDGNNEDDMSKRQKVDHPSPSLTSHSEDPLLLGPPPMSFQQHSTVLPSESTNIEPLASTYVAPIGLIEPPMPRPPAQFTLCSPNQLKYMLSSLKSLKRSRSAAPFLSPVDYVALNIPNYPNVIKYPMDLGTIELKVLAAQGRREKGWSMDMGVMESVEMFRDDLRRIWWNCKIYNGTNSIFTTWAVDVENAAEKMLQKMPKPPPPAPAKPTPLAIASSSTYSPPIDSSKPKTKSVAGAPAIRRSSSISVDGRPKREIHPPPPKELPYFAELDVKKPKLGNKRVDKEIRWGSAILKELSLKRNKEFVWPFEQPVDPVALKIPDYFKLIRRPMDLSTIKRKLESGFYRDNPTTESVEGDFRLMLDNCFTYNPPGTSVHIMGRKVEALFERMWDDFVKIDEDEGFDEEAIMNSIKSDESKIHRLRAQIGKLEEELRAVEASKKGHQDHLQKEKERLRELKAQKAKAKKEKAAIVYADAPYYDEPVAVASTSKKTDNGVPKKKKNKTKTKKPKEEINQGDKMSMPYQYSEMLSRKIETDGDNPVVSEAVAYLSTQLQMTAESEDGTVELEIDNVQPEILWKVYEMIFGPVDESHKWSSTNGNNPLASQPRSRIANGGGVTAAGGRAKKGGRAGTGGVRRKNLDEEAESARIRALEDRLKAFDEHERGGGVGQGNSSTMIPGYGGGAAAVMETMGHNDDDVSSESSEDQDVSSDEESD